MRYMFAVSVTLILFAPHNLLAQGSIDGFGALSVNRLSSLEGSRWPVDFGGRVAVDIVPSVQAIGEFGRIASVLPGAVGSLLSFSPVDLGVSALYGEGGVRFLAAPASAVTPYVEATAGVARLNFRINGLGTAGDTIARAALNLLDRTDPLAGVGGGLLFRGGPIVVDLGYRYKQIFANDPVSRLLGAGDLRSHQVRVGAGVRF